MEEFVRILMVEDLLTDARLAEREINSVLKGCAYLRVDTREDYLKALAEFKPDIVLSDYRMPVFDGMSALKLALEFDPLLPVIILTGAMNEDTAVECMKAGATDYVIKEHIKRLGRAVIHALEEKKIRQERQRAELALRESEERYRSLVQTLPDAVTVTDLKGNITFVSPVTLDFYNYRSQDEVLGQSILNWVDPDYHEKAMDLFKTVRRGGLLRNQELLLVKKDKSSFWGEASASCLKNALGEPAGIIIVVRDTSERKRAELSLKESEERYRTLAEAANDSVYVLNENGVLQYVNESGAKHMGRRPDEVIGMSLADIFPPEIVSYQLQMLHQVFDTGEPANDESSMPLPDGMAWLNTSLVPLGEKGKRATAVMGVSRDITSRKQAEEALRQSEALQRARTIELEVLFDLSTLLRKAQTAQDMFEVILKEVHRVLAIDGASIVLLNPDNQHFDIVASRGAIAPRVGQSFTRQEESFSKQVVESRQPYVSAEYINDPHRLVEESHIYNSDMNGPSAFVPIQSESEILGTLMMVRRKGPQSGQFSADEVRLLSAIGEMAGNALRRSRLFDDLQTTNTQLSLAYDDTIEALSRALDLRDKETEGHTLRVIKLALQMAREFGLEEKELVLVRRGAFLHDMGKIGIPDTILNKPGPLTEEEWRVMRQHPQYTYDMLSSIAYLRPALDIPYYHHEKWDGTGYPHRLKGEQIPLVARLFAIVDVWDALTNERPYRPAWTARQALDYIRDQSGKHFDPRVVEVFLKLVNQNGSTGS